MKYTKCSGCKIIKHNKVTDNLNTYAIHCNSQSNEGIAGYRKEPHMILRKMDNNHKPNSYGC